MPITEVHDPYKLVERMVTEEPEWAKFFQVSGEDGPERLKAQTWQWRDELRARDKKLELEEVSDALLELGHEYLGHEDPRKALFREYLHWAERQDASVRARLSGDSEDGFEEAWDSSATLGTLRKFLRARCEAAMRIAA